MKNLFIVFSLITSVCLCGCCKSELEKKAEKGDIQSQYKLAQEYKKQKDYVSEIKWLEKAAEKDFLKAQEEAAMECFLHGDRNIALKWAKESAEKNSDIGKSVLAFYCYWGCKDFPIDRLKAFKLAEETKNIPLSKSILALFYSTGFWDIKKDMAKAESLAKESIEEGCLEGMCVLSQILSKDHAKNKTKLEELNNKLKNVADEEYIDTAMAKIFIALFEHKINPEDAYNKLEKYTKFNGYLAYRYRSIIACDILRDKDYIDRVPEFNKKFSDNVKQVLQNGYCDENTFGDLLQIFDRKEDIVKVFNSAIETRNPDLIEDIYRHKCWGMSNKMSKMTITDDVLNEMIKNGADNGNAFLMLIYAYNNIDNKEIFEKYKNQALLNFDIAKFASDSKYFRNNKEFIIRIGADLKITSSAMQLGIALLNGKLENKSLKKDPEKGFQYIKDALMAAERQGMVDYIKEEIGKNIINWFNQYPEYSNRIYVFALIAKFKDKEELLSKLETTLPQEEIVVLKKEVKEINKYIDNLQDLQD